MSNNRHKNGARNQLRPMRDKNGKDIVAEAHWFRLRRKRNRVRDRIAKASRRRNRQ